MHNNLDEYLQHHGVKGMKWGQVKAKVATAVKNHNEKQKAKLEAHHEKNKNKFLYKRIYKTNRTLNPRDKHAAIRKTRNEIRALKISAGTHAAGLVAPHIIKGAMKASAFATDPKTIRAGKNIVQALKRSPIRYVNAADMKNVVKTFR